MRGPYEVELFPSNEPSLNTNMFGAMQAPPKAMVCTGPVRYVGRAALEQDIANLRAGLESQTYQEAFMSSANPINLTSARMSTTPPRSSLLRQHRRDALRSTRPSAMQVVRRQTRQGSLYQRIRAHSDASADPARVRREKGCPVRRVRWLMVARRCARMPLQPKDDCLPFAQWDERISRARARRPPTRCDHRWRGRNRARDSRCPMESHRTGSRRGAYKLADDRA
jgi:hypothetical protein